jgi:transcriptional regulator with XRE-family HTH domain
MHADIDFGNLGRRIRNLRKAHNMTLEELGERVDLSVSYLSQIETGHANINLRVLRDIAQALEVPLIDFLAEAAETDISVVRVGDRRTYELKSGVTETLLFSRDRLDLECAIMDLPAGFDSGTPNSHPGEEFTYVMQGRVRIFLGGDQVFDLNEGDIIYYRSSMSHRWENPYDQPAKIMITNTPATF